MRLHIIAVLAGAACLAGCASYPIPTPIPDPVMENPPPRPPGFENKVAKQKSLSHHVTV